MLPSLSVTLNSGLYHLAWFYLFYYLVVSIQKLRRPRYTVTVPSYTILVRHSGVSDYPTPLLSIAEPAHLDYRERL